MEQLLINYDNILELLQIKITLGSIYFILISWMIIMLFLVAFLLYKYPLNKDIINGKIENPYKGETLGLPRGLIRGILTLTILLAAVLLQVYILSNNTSVERISPFMTAFEIMLGFYFGSKVVHHLASSDKQKVQTVAKSSGEKTNDFDDPNAKG